MRITQRFRRLTIWNKIFVIAAIFGILSASLSILNSVRRSGETKPVKQEASNLKLRVHRSKYTRFIVVEPKQDHSKYMPPGSYLLTYEGANISYRREKNSQDRYFNPTSLPPHIPEGEVIIDFTLSCRGSPTIIKSIEIIQESDESLPNLAATALIKEALVPVEANVVLRSDSKSQSYTPFAGIVFSYKEGDAELFRIKITVGDEEGPSIFSFRVKVDYYSGDDIFSVFSPIMLVSKASDGKTNRIPTIKQSGRFRPQRQTLGQSLKKICRITDSRKDFETNKRFFTKTELLIGVPSVSTDLMSPKAIIDLYKNTFLQPKMSFEEIFASDNLNQSIPMLLDVMGYLILGPNKNYNEQLSLLGDNWLATSLKFHGQYAYFLVGNTQEFLLAHGWHATSNYVKLISACRRMARTGSEKSKSEVLAFLTDLVKDDRLSRAALVDTIPLLSYFLEEKSYSSLCDILLRTNNRLAVRRAISVFSSVRFTKAADELLEVLRRRVLDKTNEDFLLSTLASSQLQLYKAFAVNGTMEVFDGLQELIKNDLIPRHELRYAAYAILWSNPQKAFDFVVDVLEHEEIAEDWQLDLAYSMIEALQHGVPPLQGGTYAPSIAIDISAPIWTTEIAEAFVKRYKKYPDDAPIIIFDTCQPRGILNGDERHLFERILEEMFRLLHASGDPLSFKESPIVIEGSMGRPSREGTRPLHDIIIPGD